MSSSAGGIPFSLAHAQSNFRLLELPDELLDLLTAADPPSVSSPPPTISPTQAPRLLLVFTHRLYIKSKDRATHVPADKPNLEPAFAVLCTQDKTYKITQVSTSNSVYIVQSEDLPLEEDDMELDADGISIVGICPTTIELQPSTGSAGPHLSQLLQTYNKHSTSNSVNSATQGGPLSKETIYSNIPLSKAEIDIEWLRLCCFEIAGNCYRPDVNVLQSCWITILQTAVANDIVLNSDFDSNSLWALVAASGKDQTIPLELYNAILVRLQDSDKEQSFSPRVAAIWTAALVLESSTSTRIPRQEFMFQWKALLPYYWENDASWESLSVSGRKLSGLLIRPLTRLQDIADLSDPLNIALNKSRASDSVAAPPVHSVRRWHAQFGSKK